VCIILMDIFILSSGMPDLFSVRIYIIQNITLNIRSILRTIRIDLDSITNIEYPLGGDIKVNRIIGSNGIFGYNGLLTVKGYGRMNIVSNRKSDLVLIETQKKKYLLGPDRVEMFVSLLKKR